MEYELSILLQNTREKGNNYQKIAISPDVYKLRIKKLSWNSFSLISRTEIIFNPSVPSKSEIFSAAELNNILSYLIEMSGYSPSKIEGLLGFTYKAIQFTDITADRTIFIGSYSAPSFIMRYILGTDDELSEIRAYLPGERYTIFFTGSMFYERDHFLRFLEGRYGMTSKMCKYISVKVIKKGKEYEIFGDTQVTINSRISGLDMLLSTIYINLPDRTIQIRPSVLILDEDNKRFTVTEADTENEFIAEIMNYFISRR